MAEHKRPDWVWSDQHAGHGNIIRFFNKDGQTRLRERFWRADGSRNGFCDIIANARAMADSYNATVARGEVVYWLGDIAWGGVQWLDRFMNMLKVPGVEHYLVRGNHDDLPLDTYLQYFKDVRSEYEFPQDNNRFIFSHIPVHPTQLGTRWGCAVNAHGHTHARRLTKFGFLNDGTTPLNFGDEFDPRYFNVSVECTNFGLVHVSQLRARVSEVLDAAGASCPQQSAIAAAITGK